MVGATLIGDGVSNRSLSWSKNKDHSILTNQSHYHKYTFRIKRSYENIFTWSVISNYYRFCSKWRKGKP